MAYFAVSYDFVDDKDRFDELRPAHQAHLRAGTPQCEVVAGGRLLDGPAGALVIVRADSVEHVAQFLDTDPFDRAGLVTGRTIREWTIRLGTWVEED
ncbi:YciI family protein [Ammonicoccus fulvus]|uniref:YciI family protein n=1 Tax=Ammonicoccus fulvus TaxID=3138240 RepID=A0ABZ3FMW6_9ACTN